MSQKKRNNVRILPRTEIHSIMNALLVDRDDIREMVSLTIDKDGTICFHTSIDDVFRVNGILDLLMQELRSSLISGCLDESEEEEPEGG